MRLENGDPRPGGVPYYIPNRCSECGGPLALYDEVFAAEEVAHRREMAKRFGDSEEPVTWHDEWACPVCRDGVYMDWSPEEMGELRVALADPPTRILQADGSLVPIG